MVQTAAIAMRSAAARQTAIANNLANTATPGFRGDVTVGQTFALVGPGGAMTARAMAAERGVGVDMTPGAIQTTGRALDIAPLGDALIAVQDGQGDPAWTRRGDLEVAPSGLLQTGDGFLVRGVDGPIAIPAGTEPRVDPDGTVSAVRAGAPPTVLGRIALARATGTSLIKTPEGLLAPANGAMLSPDSAARVRPGAIEASNVAATDALVAMIETQRGYEAQVRVITTAEQIDDAGKRLMSLTG